MLECMRDVTRHAHRKHRVQSGNKMTIWRFLQRSCLQKKKGCIQRAFATDLNRLSITQSSNHERISRYPCFRALSQVSAGSTADIAPTLSPAVRYLVGTHSITDLAPIQASGPKNRLLKG